MNHDQPGGPATPTPKRASTSTTWKPGQSGNPRGRPRKGNALAEMVREAADPRELVETMLDVLRNAESDAIRIQAAQWLRDSGYQRPSERVELGGAGSFDEDDEDLSTLSLDELEALDALDRRHEDERRALLARRIAHELDTPAEHATGRGPVGVPTTTDAVAQDLLPMSTDEHEG